MPRRPRHRPRTILAAVLLASFIAVLLAGQARPAEVAPVAEEKSAARRHAEYLVSLIIDWERKAADPTSPESAYAADVLAHVDRCLDLPTDCLDGSFVRRLTLA